MFASLRSIASRIRGLFSFRREDKDFTAELDEHLNMLAEENIRRGMSPREARRQAHIRLGGSSQLRETNRQLRGLPFLETLWQDVRFAARMLRRNPGFTIVAVLTLALGIGANTAIFSMVDSFLFRVAPVVQPQQVATLDTEQVGGTFSAEFSYADFQDIRNQSTNLFSDVAASVVLPPTDGLSAGGENRPIWASYVTGNFFETMGVKPALGNLIESAPEGSVDSDPVLVLGYTYWKTHFGGDANVIGKTVSINGHPVTIIGVAPKGFHGISTLLDIQGYLPLGMAAVTGDVGSDFFTNRKSAELGISVRLKQGMTLASALPTLNVIGRRLSAQYPEADKWKSLMAYGLTPDSPVDDPSGITIVLVTGGFFLALAAMVLLLACLNVANLLLARASAREREMALRAAIGAKRSRLVRQLLTESLLLAMLGGAGGIYVGWVGSGWLGSINLRGPLPLLLDFQFDWRVFVYALGAALLTGVVVGIAPALRATRGDLNDNLHKSGRTATAGRQRARSALIVVQVGGSLMLLIVAGLFVRSLQGVEHSSLGFDPHGVLNFTMNPHEAGYNEAQGRHFLQDLLPRVRALPGVESASLAATVPMGYSMLASELKIAGYQQPVGQPAPSAGYNAVSSDYFKTMGIPIIRGRGILDSDTQASPHVAVINEAMAQKYWHDEDPIGMRFTMLDDPAFTVEVVGIAKNSRTAHLHGSVDPYVYLSLAQRYQVPVTVQVRTSLPLAVMNRQILGVVQSLAPTMPVFDVQTMTDALDTIAGLMLYQIAAGLAGALGMLGLALAVIGVYGVVSFTASQRTHEIGIRMALGAQPFDVLQMVLRQGFWIVGAGILAGVLAAFSIARLAANFLTGVSPLDPLTYVTASVLLAAVALLACCIPARRAMKVDPMVALRHE